MADDLASQILNSEAMRWLMCGGDPAWRDSHIATLRPAWLEWRRQNEKSPAEAGPSRSGS